MTWTPRPVTQDPVPVYLPNQTTPVRHESAHNLLDRYGAACQFGDARVQFIEPVGNTYTAPHRLFARFAGTRSGTMYDTALVLGLSFLMHNNCEHHLQNTLGQFTAYLDIR
jgi:hypothetical protein